VAWAAGNGIISGYDAETFGPNDNITREQLAAILHNYAQYRKIDVTASDSLASFTDATVVSDWALANMKWAVAERLFSGVTTNALTKRRSYKGSGRGNTDAVRYDYLKIIRQNTEDIFKGCPQSKRRFLSTIYVPIRKELGYNA
jgi:hypothetical protein